jgi:photosystem II stability/assembly factor-like uncharacterized protein
VVPTRRFGEPGRDMMLRFVLATVVPTVLLACAVLFCGSANAAQSSGWVVIGTLPDGFEPVDAAFVDASRGCVVGTNSLDMGAILTTTDGGSTWQETYTTEASAPLSGVASLGTSSFWVVGPGRLVRSTDGGTSWTSTATPHASVDQSGVCFVDALHGWVAGAAYYDSAPPNLQWEAGGYVLATMDGGATWTTQVENLPLGLTSVSFANVTSGWAVGPERILRTSDGGRHWSQRSGITFTARHVAALTADRACLAEGPLAFADPHRGWTRRYQGWIESSTDGGQTWYRQRGPVDSADYTADVSALAASDAAHAWAFVGTQVLATTNGGVDDGPLTVASVREGGWYNGGRSHSVKIVLTAKPGPTGSPVQATEYRTVWDPPSWTTGTVAVVPAPVDHSADGLHEVVYRSTDAAGQVEVAQVRTVYIDTQRPTSDPQAASARRGRLATLSYYLEDAWPNAGRVRPVIKVKNPAGKVVKTLRPGFQPTHPYGGIQIAKFTVPVTWKGGAYRFFMYLTDAAGNSQARVKSATLTVR